MKSFGVGTLVLPHCIHIDREDNVWVADGLGKDGKAHQVIKFSPDGKVLLTLGKPGIAGSGLDEFNAPSAVLVAPNGDIFVADGHGGNTDARIVKFDKHGKFIRLGERRAPVLARWTSPMPSRWIRVGGSFSPIAAITVSRFSTRSCSYSFTSSTMDGEASP